MSSLLIYFYLFIYIILYYSLVHNRYLCIIWTHTAYYLYGYYTKYLLSKTFSITYVDESVILSTHRIDVHLDAKISWCIAHFARKRLFSKRIGSLGLFIRSNRKLVCIFIVYLYISILFYILYIFSIYSDIVFFIFYFFSSLFLRLSIDDVTDSKFVLLIIRILLFLSDANL